MNTEKEKTQGKSRSKEWPKVRKAYLKKHPKCFVCLGTKKLNVHHVRPFHLFPERELDPTNLITLCEGDPQLNCHLIFGHWNNFARKYNVNIREEAKIWRKRLKGKFKMV